MSELRCPSKKHGEIVDHNVVEIKCDSRFCGAGSGTVVLHRFDTVTGEILSTSSYRDPRKGKKES